MWQTFLGDLWLAVDFLEGDSDACMTLARFRLYFCFSTTLDGMTCNPWFFTFLKRIRWNRSFSFTWIKSLKMVKYKSVATLLHIILNSHMQAIVWNRITWKLWYMYVLAYQINHNAFETTIVINIFLESILHCKPFTNTYFVTFGLIWRACGC